MQRTVRIDFKFRSLSRLGILGVVVLSLLYVHPAGAQATAIRFERLTIEDGLSQNAVLSIAQDSLGYLWFGTEDGLNKYDGYEFTIYSHDPEDPSSLTDNFTSALLVDQNGEIWVGTRSGLDRYDRATDTFEHFLLSNDPSGNWVISLYEDQAGDVWVGTEEGGLNALDRETGGFTQYLLNPEGTGSLGENAVRVIYEDSSSNFWIGAHQGLFTFDRQTGVFQDYLTQIGSEIPDVSTVLEDQNGVLWVGTEESGVLQVDPESGEAKVLHNDPDNPYSLSHDRVRALFEDNQGDIWIGTQNGLNLLPQADVNRAREDPHFHIFHNNAYDPASLSSNAVWSIFEDRSGVLWFGTWGGGISKYNRSTDRFRLYQHNPVLENSLSDNMIWSIMENVKGRLWIGTLNGGLNMLDRVADRLVVYRHDEDDPGSLINDDVRAVLSDRSGRLWVGTAGGLDLLQRDKTFKHYVNDPEDSNTISGNRVNVLLQGKSGGIWVGTRYDGLNYLEPSTGVFTRFLHDPNDPESLSDNRIWALYEDHLGNIWVGTLDGISVLDPDSGRFRQYRHVPDDLGSLSSNSIFAFYEDAEGRVWIGTWGGGLDRFDPETNRFIHFTIEDGLPNDTIYGIEADLRGNLWMSTNRGISKFDPESGEFENFDVLDGLQDNEFNVGAHYRSPSGELFFGGIRGFNAFFPEDIQDNPIPPSVVITTFYKFNQPIQHDLSPDEPIVLDYKDNFIAFEFAALDFSSPENNQYQYMLEGFDPDWIEAGTRRYASYTNLDGGEYVFRVRGSNSDGVWNMEGTSVDITVRPPFWETAWFQILAFATLALVGVGWYRWRVRSIEARSRELEQLIAQRTFEIEQRREELDALYRADEQLFRHLEIEQVFRVLMDIAMDILHAEKGSLWFWDDRIEQLVVQASSGFTTESIGHMRIASGEGSIHWIMRTGESVFVADIQDNPQLASWLADTEGIHSFMSVPIMVRDRVYGVFNVNYLEPDAFGEEEQRMFSALAQRAAIAIEQAQLQDQAQRTAVLEERQRIARDLHDAVTQTLFSANLISEVLPTLWEKDPEIGRSRLVVLHQLTRGALAEMRNLLYELRPSALEKAELPELLQQVADSSIGRARIPVAVQIEGDCHLEKDSKIALYRIAQEAMNNVVKHSAASRAEIRIHCRTNSVELIVEDDGIGFDPAQVPEERLGLGIMQERAASISADFTIESSPGGGTRIRLQIMNEANHQPEEPAHDEK